MYWNMQGYQISPSLNLDPINTYNYNNMQLANQYFHSNYGMEGAGILDIASSIYNKASQFIPKAYQGIKEIGNKGLDLYGSERGNKITDFISSKISSNPNARPGYPGERHVFLNTPYGFTKANFAGPQTQITKRLVRGDKGINQIDEAAKIHDIEYNEAKTKQDIRDADNKFIRKVKAANDSSDLQKSIVVSAIRAKKIGEDVGVLDVESFTKLPGLRGSGFMSDMELDALIQRIKPSPGQFLKSDAIKQIKKRLSKKQRGKGHYYKKPIRPRSLLMRQYKKQNKKYKGGNLGSVLGVTTPLIIRQIAKIINKRKGKRKGKR